MRPLVWKKINWKKKGNSGGFLILLMLVLACYGLRPVIQRTSRESIGTPCANPVFVEVVGDIRSPGVYTFCNRPALEDILKSIGKPDFIQSDPNFIKNKLFRSGLKIHLRDEGEKNIVSVMEMSAFSKMTLGLPIYLNKEDEVGLTALPGIGKSLARAIIEERQNRGGFKNLNELKEIKGIGEKLIEKMKPHLVL